MLEAVGRIGRCLGKYPAAARIADVIVQRDSQARACALSISSRTERGQ